MTTTKVYVRPQDYQAEIERLKTENARLKHVIESLKTGMKWGRNLLEHIHAAEVERLKQEKAELVEALEEIEDALGNLLNLRREKQATGKIEYYLKYYELAWQEAEKANEKASAILTKGGE